MIKKLIILILALVIIDGVLIFLNAVSKEKNKIVIVPEAAAPAAIPPVSVPVASPKPEIEIVNPIIQTGEVLIVELSEAPRQVIFDGKEIVSFPYRDDYRAVIPMPLGTKSGTYNLKAEFEDGLPAQAGTIIEETITLRVKEQQIIVLPPPPKLGLTDKQIVQNLVTSNTDLKKIVAEIEEITRFSKPFGPPVGEEFIISSPFGEIRRTGEQSIIHLGVDFDVPRGTAVYAINDGVVKSAYLDSIYGNSVIVDHGRGIYSLYLHLDSMSVKTGDAVEKGEVIGAAGDSGLSSAPHLHLSLKINGISIDPVQFIQTFK